jgi:large subunit ribosomal protein L18
MTNLKTTARKRRQARVKGKVFGTSRPRLVVFRSLNNNYAQLIDDQKHQTIASASDLKASKGSKMERAKQVGLELAKMALEKNIKNCVFDRNGYRYHGRVKALADGAREGGLQF